MFITLGAGILFSLFQLSFHLDVSLVAFPLSAAASFFALWSVFVRVYKRKEFKAVFTAQKILQYLPYVYLASFIARRAGGFGTFYWYDVVTVLLWAVVLVARYFVLHYFNEKRVLVLEPSWKGEKKGLGLIVKPSGARRIVFEVLDWVDAIVQAVFMVLIFQIFVLQLYVIPSESMVPSFLIGDRVIVLKTPSGPKMPLSEVGFPCVKKYRRGDVVVFRNPHYSMDRKSEIRSVVSQIVYMLTFSTVNLNVDERGEPKADPLVKRVAGLPGEQIVMQDGMLYSRTRGSDVFSPVPIDSKFAKWNLNELSPRIRQNVQTVPLSSEQYGTMLEVEEYRRGLDVESAALECASISRRFAELSRTVKKEADFSEPSLFEYDIFSNVADQSIIFLNARGGDSWFSSFMTDWISHRKEAFASFSGDPYAEANYRLNIMMKLLAGRLYLRTAELYAQGKKGAEIASDSSILDGYEMAEKLHFYALILDQRNMPVFPANAEDGSPSYIDEDSYFMMGDNRFNSLDMRHSYTQSMKPLTPHDRFSLMYESNMAPQTIHRSHILGSAMYRFWPLSRRGVVQTR